MPSETPTNPEMPAVAATAPDDPSKPGAETSEFGLTKLFTILGSVVALALPVLAAVSDALMQLQGNFPAAKWLAVAAGVAATMLGVARALAGYNTGRAGVKVAQIQGAAQVQSAKEAASPR